jgi:hypothetical protein
VFIRPGADDAFAHDYGKETYRDFIRKHGYSTDRPLCLLFDKPDK